MPSGGGSSSSGTKVKDVASAGPARSLATMPQYNPIMYQGMQPGALPGSPGMSLPGAGGMPTAPMQSYMPAVQGLPGFGGQSANQLVQSLMAGYAGVPMATQPTGANAPGMGFMTQATPPPGTPSTNPLAGLTGKALKRAQRALAQSGGAGIGGAGMSDLQNIYPDWYSGGGG